MFHKFALFFFVCFFAKYIRESSTFFCSFLYTNCAFTYIFVNKVFFFIISESKLFPTDNQITNVQSLVYKRISEFFFSTNRFCDIASATASHNIAYISLIFILRLVYKFISNEVSLPVCLSAGSRVLATSATELLLPLALDAYKMSIKEVPVTKSCTRNVGLSSDVIFSRRRSLAELYTSRWKACVKPPL